MIREAVTEDIPALVRMGRDMCTESSFHRAAYDPVKAVNSILGIINSPDGFAMVVVRDEAVVGAMLGGLSAPWFSHQKVAVDYALYIEPKYRGGYAAARLISSFIQWSRQRGVTHIRPGISTGGVGEVAERLYERLGFTRTGALFMMEV